MNAVQRLPARLAAALDGAHLGDGDTHTALVLASRRPSGGVHVSLVSRGEVVAVAPDRLLLAVHAGTNTAENLRTTGEATLMLVDEDGTTTVALSVDDPRDLTVAGMALAAFDARVSDAREHSVPYAEVTSGITFRVHDADATLARWVATVAALRREYAVT